MHYNICADYMLIFYRGFFYVFFQMFFVSTLAAVSYFNKLTAKNVAELVAQEDV